MLVAVRPQEDGTLELEPVSAEFRDIVCNLNYVDNTCIAYIEADPDLEAFKDELDFCDVDKLNCGKHIETEMSVEVFMQFLPLDTM